MRCSKWLALLIALCLLASTLTVAVAVEIDIDLDDTHFSEVEGGLALDDAALPEGGLSIDLPPLEAEEELLVGEEEEQADSSEATDAAPVPNNKNYTDMSNSTAFNLNGVTVRAADEGTHGSGNCWAWAQAIYKKIWGCRFDSTFEGTAARGHNLLRNLTDNERKLTPENLKYFVSHAKPGATLRVQSCPSSCSGFNTDGCSKHEKHSLIIAEIRSDGLVTMDDQGSVHTRFYTWEGFCNSWQRWVYVKYIKWPNAPALASVESIDGYGVSKISETYRVRSTATKGAVVYSLPTGGRALTTLKYPATFKATAKAIKTVNNTTWVHGKSSTGVTGWLPVTSAVAAPGDTISVTGVSLDQSTLILVRGGTATLKAVVAPVDATNQGVTWSSSDTSVVRVSNGTVTGVSSGTATVTATTLDGARKATCNVMVANTDFGKQLTKTGSNGTVTLTVGKTLQLIPTFATTKGWKIKSVSSSKTKYATVSKYGLVKAKKAGTTTITVKCRNGKKATLKVKVVKASSGGGSSSVQPTKVYISKTGTVELKVGKTMKVYTKLYPSNATTTFTWKSSNTSVAYVDNEGNVLALKKGTCKIGVKTANDKYAWFTLKVV